MGDQHHNQIPFPIPLEDIKAETAEISEVLNNGSPAQEEKIKLLEGELKRVRNDLDCTRNDLECSRRESDGYRKDLECARRELQSSRKDLEFSRKESDILQNEKKKLCDILLKAQRRIENIAPRCREQEETIRQMKCTRCKVKLKSNKPRIITVTINEEADRMEQGSSTGGGCQAVGGLVSVVGTGTEDATSSRSSETSEHNPPLQIPVLSRGQHESLLTFSEDMDATQGNEASNNLSFEDGLIDNIERVLSDNDIGTPGYLENSQRQGWEARDGQYPSIIAVYSTSINCDEVSTAMPNPAAGGAAHVSHGGILMETEQGELRFNDSSANEQNLPTTGLKIQHSRGSKPQRSQTTGPYYAINNARERITQASNSQGINDHQQTKAGQNNGPSYIGELQTPSTSTGTRGGMPRFPQGETDGWTTVVLEPEPIVGSAEERGNGNGFHMRLRESRKPKQYLNL